MLGHMDFVRESIFSRYYYLSNWLSHLYGNVPWPNSSWPRKWCHRLLQYVCHLSGPQDSLTYTKEILKSNIGGKKKISFFFIFKLMASQLWFFSGNYVYLYVFTIFYTMLDWLIYIALYDDALGKAPLNKMNYYPQQLCALIDNVISQGSMTL